MKILLIYTLLSLIAIHAEAFDHSYQSYDQILKQYVHDGLVDYAGLLRRRKSLDAFINEIKAVGEADYTKWSRKQQLAFWINTYNGWFLQIVIDHYPIKKTRSIGIIYPVNSVQQIPDIWDGIKLTTAGSVSSLNDIEHKILRPVFQEPRIHFAIVCASLGCPKLRNEAYTTENLEKQLEDATGTFINDQRKVRLMRAEKTLQVSKIFKWFAGDFKSFEKPEWRSWYSQEEAGTVGFISKYLPADDLKFLNANGVKVEYLEYDWTLNAT